MNSSALLNTKKLSDNIQELTNKPGKIEISQTVRNLF